MGFEDAITEALGLQGAELGKIEFDREKLIATVAVTWPFHLSRCCQCGDFLLEVHSWETREVRAPAFGIYRTTLKLRYARGLCRSCDRIRTARVLFVHREFGGLTCGLAEQAGRMMEEMTCAATARLLGLNEKTLWRLDQWRMERMRGQLRLEEITKSLDLSKLSADEVHFRTIEEKRRDHPFAARWQTKFITNLVCTKEAKVIANASGRDAKALAACLKTLTKPERLSVEFFALDMHPGFFSAVRKLCPNAEIAVDRFHLVQQLNKAFDEVRKSEFRMAKRGDNEFLKTMLGPRNRFILVERNAALSPQEEDMLGKLKMLNDNIHNAMLVVDYFHRLLDERGVGGFRRLLAQWYGLVRKAKLKPLREFASQVRKYRRNIEAYIRENLTTAISEGINNKIRVLKAMAYGYTNEQSFMLKILQRCGFLNSQYIDTKSWFFYVPPEEPGTKPHHAI
jgi:Transposase and inactivated derivatives